MCTVTYIPQGNNGFILSSNRDEAPSRSANEIQSKEINGKKVIFPQDVGAGGTWLAVSDTGQVICLLNGAFIKHERKLPYKKSRGIMVLEFFEYKNAEDFLNNYPFEGMEAHTLVIVDSGKVFSFVWDEKEKHISILGDSSQYVWSSSTLYNAEKKLKRLGWWHKWQNDNPNPGLKEISKFHFEGGKGDVEDGIVMNRRDIVRTVSVSFVEKTEDKIGIKHHDLLNDVILESNMDL